MRVLLVIPAVAAVTLLLLTLLVVFAGTSHVAHSGIGH
jgi:hypothetical protein